MKPFKFFEREKVGNLDMIDDITRATASFNADTPDGHAYRRRLYHTDNNLYNRLRNSNNEMEQYFYERGLRQNHLTEEQQSELSRRINGGMSQESGLLERLQRAVEENQPPPMIPYQSNDVGLSNYVPPIGESYYQRFFPQVTVTQVNPKWWMKIKMFFQEMKIKMYIEDNQDMFGVMFIATAVTICVGLIIGKILSVW